MKTKHRLKIWPLFFEEVRSGRKTFEIRKNDRDFQAGDILVLEEWDPKMKLYTDRMHTCQVGFVVYSGFGLQEGYCCMSLLPMPDYTFTDAA